MQTIIQNARLLDCVKDAAQEGSCILVEDGVIKDVLHGKGPAVPSGAGVIDAGGRTVMPALVDAHQHFAVTTNDLGGTYFDPPFLTALRIKAQLEKTLAAGFTTVRDGGGGHWSIKQAVEDGLINGPRVLISGAMLSTTGGHGDFNVHGEMALRPERIPFLNLQRTCDGEDDCRRAVREQFQKGADQIKICVSGGCASPNDEAWQIQFTEREIRAIVEEAESRGTYVMAHCLNDQGIRRAVECGVKSIEHGAFMSGETAALMKEQGASLVSTLAILQWADDRGRQEGATEWFLRKLSNPGRSPDGVSLREGSVRGIKTAARAGVQVGSGTDYFGTMCGTEDVQIRLNTSWASPMQSIKASTAVNARILGLGDRLGTIERSKWADLIIVDGCPDQDPAVLANPERVKLVMKQGKVVKDLL